MLARGDETELIEKRGHPENFPGRNSEKGGKVRYSLLGDKPEFGLHSLKDRDEVFFRGGKLFEKGRDRISDLFLFSFIDAVRHCSL
jgi:hypothetical protein